MAKQFFFLDLGVSIVMGVPQKRRMVYVMENPI